MKISVAQMRSIKGDMLANIAKSQNGVDKALRHFSDIASKYSMTVLMANCIGHCDNFESVGKTSIWNNKGNLVTWLHAKVCKEVKVVRILYDSNNRRYQVILREMIVLTLSGQGKIVRGIDYLLFK